MDELVVEFLAEARSNLSLIDSEMLKLADNLNDKAAISNIYRSIHTIKGAAGLLSFSRLESLTHSIENTLAKLRKSELSLDTKLLSTLTESIQKINHLVSSIEASGSEPGGDDSELKTTPPLPSKPQISNEAKQQALSEGLKTASNIIIKQPVSPSVKLKTEALENLIHRANNLMQVKNEFSKALSASNDSHIKELLKKLSEISGNLQKDAIKTITQPVGSLKAKLSRTVKKLAKDLNKKANFRIIGEHILMDHHLFNLINDPLIHIIRNAVDHGIESPKERIISGKAEAGTITLSAAQEGSYIELKISDDGSGLNLERIKRTIISQGLSTLNELEKLSENEIYQYIFLPSFSTSENISYHSGRGIGMDIVKTTIEKAGGSVKLISSELNGTTIIIRLPLSISVIPALLIESGKFKFALPEQRISEVIKFPNSNDDIKIETLGDIKFLKLRGRLIPILSLASQLEIENKTPENSCIVVIEIASKYFGLSVDNTLHSEEIIIKPLPSSLKNMPLYSGITTLASGELVMALDIPGIVKKYGTKDNAFAIENNIEQEAVNTSLLVFKAWDKILKCTPLELIVRVDEIDMARTEWLGNYKIARYQDSVVYLTMLSEEIPLPEDGVYTIIIFSSDNTVLGLIVEKVIKVVEYNIKEKNLATKSGEITPLIVDGKPAEFIDLSNLFLKSPAQVTTKLSSAKTRLLMIDDSPFFRKFMQPILEKTFNAVICGSASKAIDLLEKGAHFDIILTDIEMPEISGIEFMQRVKLSPKYHDIPVIALTSYSGDEFISNITELGFDGYVSKAKRNTLAERIKEILAENKITV